MNLSSAKVKRGQCFCQETEIKIGMGVNVRANEKLLYYMTKPYLLIHLNNDIGIYTSLGVLNISMPRQIFV